jgi:hypothetical protein
VGSRQLLSSRFLFLRHSYYYFAIVSIITSNNNFTEQSYFSEVGSLSSDQNTPLLWNSTVHYRIHNGYLLESILCQLNPVHNLTTDSRSILSAELLDVKAGVGCSYYWVLKG